MHDGVQKYECAAEVEGSLLMVCNQVCDTLFLSVFGCKQTKRETYFSASCQKTSFSATACQKENGPIEQQRCWTPPSHCQQKQFKLKKTHLPASDRLKGLFSFEILTFHLSPSFSFTPPSFFPAYIYSVMCVSVCEDAESFVWDLSH